jgi:anti-anti-sigma regulatory factor
MQQEHHVTEITLSGSADLGAGQRLRSKLAHAPRGDALLLDLSGLTELNVMIIGLLIGAGRRWPSVSVVVPDDRHREILGRIRVTQLVALYPSREEALAFLSDA